MEIQGNGRVASPRAIAPHAEAATPRAGSVPIEVWVPDAKGGRDQLVHSSTGVTSTDRIVREAHANARTVLDYVQREFGRSSFDGRGTVLKLRVHAPDPITGAANANNAFWFNDEKRIWLGDGDGTTFKPLGGAADVVAHEFFHGVIDSEVRLAYVGQEGALHESFSDILASGVDGNWQIGEGVFTPGRAGDAIRDMSKLGSADWRTFPDWQDEVHAMSEVPSHAAFLVGRSIGAEALRSIWYTAVTDHLRSGAGFAGARDATIAAARVLYGATSREANAVIDAWAAVGIDATTPKVREPAALGPAAAATAALLAQPHPILA